MSNNADEVSIERIDDNGGENGPEEVLFLGKSVVSSLFSSGNDFSTLVPGVEVDDIPDSEEGVRDDNLDVSSSNFSSSGGVVSVEESNKEAGSNNSWD